MRELGLLDQIEQANSVEDLRKILFDVEALEVTLAIQEALHPEDGKPIAECFSGIGKRALKGILKARFAEAKRLRAQSIRRVAKRDQPAEHRRRYDWTDDLKLHAKTSAILPMLANLILFLRHHQKWAGVFAFDEFATASSFARHRRRDQTQTCR